MYYPYKNETIISKEADQPESGDYCVSNIDFNLDLYTIYVGAVDADKQLTYYTQRAKPAEQLAQIIKAQQAENDLLGQTVAGLSLQNMQLNTALDTLGGSLAQAQLDIMTLKGGAA